MKLDRRTFLLAAGTVVLGGCGDADPRVGTATKALARRSVGIDYASSYAPIDDVRRLATARARALGAEVTFSDDAAGVDAQVANLKQWTGPTGGFRAVALAAFDSPAVDELVAAAIESGVRLVAYVTQLEHQSAGITVDYARMGALLAGAAPHAPVLVVRPPAQPSVPDPFAINFAAAEAAIKRTRDVAAAVEAQGQADATTLVAAALRDDPTIRAVLCWNDQAAMGAAEAAGDRRWVGGLGSPSLTGRAPITALRKDGPLRCLVAPRLAELTDALVEVPFALARGERTGSRGVPVAVLRRESRKLAAYASDFSA